MWINCERARQSFREGVRGVVIIAFTSPVSLHVSFSLLSLISPPPLSDGEWGHVSFVPRIYATGTVYIQHHQVQKAIACKLFKHLSLKKFPFTEAILISKRFSMHVLYTNTYNPFHRILMATLGN